MVVRVSDMPAVRVADMREGGQAHGTFTRVIGRLALLVGTMQMLPGAPFTWITGLGLGDGTGDECATGALTTWRWGGKMLFHGTISSARAMSARAALPGVHSRDTSALWSG